MYTQPFQYPSGYSSLNTSIVLSPSHSHNRTQSHTRIPYLPLHHNQPIRAPSQKKLTLVCQTNPSTPRNFTKEVQGGLKKRGTECFGKKGKFVSLQSSQVAENKEVFSKPQIVDRQNSPLNELKRSFQQRFKQLQQLYTLSFTESSNQIRQLQIKLTNNSRQLQSKDNKIKQLESGCKEYQTKMSKMIKDNVSSNICSKVNDLQSKMRVLTHHYGEMSDEHNRKVQTLTKQVISYFGKKLSELKIKNTSFVKASTLKITQLKHQLQLPKYKSQTHSVATRQSMQSVGSQIHLTQHSQDHGISFWDDCFFYPKSEDFELVVAMAKKRQQPLSCWIDQEDYVRYTDTSSYIFNRKGDRIKLSRQEVQELIEQKLMIIL